jgi:hypothetical protein
MLVAALITGLVALAAICVMLAAMVWNLAVAIEERDAEYADLVGRLGDRLGDRLRAEAADAERRRV